MCKPELGGKGQRSKGVQAVASGWARTAGHACGLGKEGRTFEFTKDQDRCTAVQAPVVM